MTRHIPCQPDHGDRFARMWARYHTPETPFRAIQIAAVVLGAVALWVAL